MSSITSLRGIGLSVPDSQGNFKGVSVPNVWPGHPDYEDVYLRPHDCKIGQGIDYEKWTPLVDPAPRGAFADSLELEEFEDA